MDIGDFAKNFDAKTAVVLPTKPSRTGRKRLKLIGRMSGYGIVAAIASPLGAETLSLVSLRIASQQERNLNGF